MVVEGEGEDMWQRNLVVLGEEVMLVLSPRLADQELLVHQDKVMMVVRDRPRKVDQEVLVVVVVQEMLEILIHHHQLAVLVGLGYHLPSLDHQ